MKDELKKLLTPTTQPHKVFPPMPKGLVIFDKHDFVYIARFYDDTFYDLLFTIENYKKPHELSYKKYRLREYIFYYEKRFEMADKILKELFYEYHKTLMLQLYAEFDTIVLPVKANKKFKKGKLSEVFKNITEYNRVVDRLIDKGFLKRNNSGNLKWNLKDYGSGKVLADFYYYLSEKDLLNFTRKDNSDQFAKIMGEEFGLKRDGRTIRSYKNNYSSRSNTFTFLSI